MFLFSPFLLMLSGKVVSISEKHKAAVLGSGTLVSHLPCLLQVLCRTDPAGSDK